MMHSLKSDTKDSADVGEGPGMSLSALANHSVVADAAVDAAVAVAVQTKLGLEAWAC
jgi:hypothetical protein